MTDSLVNSEFVKGKFLNGELHELAAVSAADLDPMDVAILDNTELGLTPNASQHLDEAVLASLQDVMGGDYPMLLDTFMLDSEDRVRLLNNALVANDIEQLGLAAHSFKGSCSNMGALRLADLCRTLEDQARRLQTEGNEQLVRQIAAEFTIVRQLFVIERLRVS